MSFSRKGFSGLRAEALYLQKSMNFDLYTLFASEADYLMMQDLSDAFFASQGNESFAYVPLSSQGGEPANLDCTVSALLDPYVLKQVEDLYDTV
jgi:hypothetical protein